MKHSGKARAAAVSLIVWTLVALVVLFITGFIATLIGTLIGAISIFLIVLWILFAGFTLYFFRDPTPRAPAGDGLIVAPAHGKIYIVDHVNEPLFMGGPCQRISIFL